MALVSILLLLKLIYFCYTCRGSR